MAFEHVSEQALSDIGGSLEEYKHKETGLRHIHVRREDAERGFTIAIPTLPFNEKGIPHILEHLSLSGGEKFPVRDAFFSMLRNSVASYMNAMTGQNYTLFPFATPSAQDYWNLMDVYTDAVFAPRLHKLDFLQEGWRGAYDKDGAFKIEGVVYNEMQGAMNGRDRRWAQTLDKAWQGDGRHGLNAGGEPRAIPTLSYEELLEFHSKHYHPSRMILLTYGNMAASEVQERMEAGVLSRKWAAIEKVGSDTGKETEQKGIEQSGPVQKIVEMPVPSEGDPEQEHSISLAWALPGGTHLDRLRNLAMEQLLFQAGGAIHKTIEEADFCRMGMVGILEESKPPLMIIELQGMRSEDVVRGEKLIKHAANTAAETVFTSEQVKAVMRDFEVKQRDITSIDGMPFGLAKICDAGQLALEGRDPKEAFSGGLAIKALQKELEEPSFINKWAEKYLAKDPNLTFHAIPDPSFQEREAEALLELTTTMERALTQEEREHIIKEQAELDLRQQSQGDVDVLPRLHAKDLSKTPQAFIPVSFIAGNNYSPASSSVPINANGITHLMVDIDVGRPPDGLLPWVDLTVSISSMLGLGKMNWQEAMQWRQQALHRHGAIFSDGRKLGENAVFVKATFSASGLTRDANEMAVSLARCASHFRVDETERIKQLIGDHYRALKQSMSERGDQFALGETLAQISPTKALQHRLSGRGSIAFLQDVYEKLKTPGGTKEVLGNLKKAKEWLDDRPVHVACGGDGAEEARSALCQALTKRKGNISATGTQFKQPTLEGGNVALIGKTAVSYVHEVWKAPRQEEPGSGLCAVLGTAVTLDFLHTAVREKGGAYGAKASYAAEGAIVMSSYRDPRLGGTLEDFAAASAWAQGEGITGRLTEEAILATLRRMDAPRSPAHEIGAALGAQQSGLSEQVRLRVRQEILAATPEKLREMAKQIFNKPSIKAAFISEDKAVEAMELGLNVKPLDPTQADLKDSPKKRIRIST